MTLKKHVTAPNPTLAKEIIKFNSTKEQPFVPFLSHVTTGCSVKDIDPTACVPMFLSRGRQDNAVCKLRCIINGEDGTDRGSGTTLTGFVSGSPSSVVVPLVGSLKCFLEDHVRRLGLSGADAEEFKARHDVWYGVVDGCQLHCAIIGSIEEMPVKWGSFRWKVFVLRSGLPVEEYRKLAIVQNERCRQVNHFEPTLFELLHGLRRIYDSLFSEQLKLSRCGSRGVVIKHRDVAFNYDGGNHERNTTVKQTVSIAIRLAKRTIEAIGLIANMSCADIILNCSELNTKHLTSKKAILSSYDCRLFKHFLCSSTIRGAPSFCNAVKDGAEEAQVNSIFRARNWCELNGYKSLKPAVLVDQFNLSKQALVEEEKFLSLINDSVWPTSMQTTRENLLRSTICDEDLRLNKGNENDVLPCLWECFKRQFPARAKGLIESQQDPSPSSPDRSEQLPIPPNSAADDGKEDEMSKKEEERRAREEVKRAEAARRLSLRCKADSYLSESGIHNHRMSISAFQRDVWKSDSNRFDLVLSAIPKDCDSDTLAKIPSLCKSTLKTGCYVALILSEEQVSEVRKKFAAEAFKVCNHSYKILYDTNTLKRRKIADFPQRNDDLCFIAKTSGTHPSGFIPDFAEEDKDDSTASSTFSSVVNVASCVNKLKAPKTNSAIYPEERSVDVFIHLIRLFSPANGSVLDPFAGPLSVSLACLKTSRTCVAINGEDHGTNYAVGRLRIFATPDATMERLDVYVDECDANIDDVVDGDSAEKDGNSTCADAREITNLVNATVAEQNDEEQLNLDQHRTDETNGIISETNESVPPPTSDSTTGSPCEPFHESSQPPKRRRVEFVNCEVEYEVDEPDNPLGPDKIDVSGSKDRDAEAADTLASICVQRN